MKIHIDKKSASDSALVAAAVRGDEAAARSLYERYAPRVRRQIARSVGDRDPSAVDDLCQDVWINAFRGLHRFRGDARLGTWLHVITRRRLIEWTRARARALPEVAPERGGERGGEHAGEASARPRVAAEPVGLRIDLERAVRTLPDGMRRILWLHDVEGHTHAQIGRRLGIHPGTSRSQLFRARARMREALLAGRPVADAA